MMWVFDGMGWVGFWWYEVGVRCVLMGFEFDIGEGGWRWQRQAFETAYVALWATEAITCLPPLGALFNLVFVRACFCFFLFVSCLLVPFRVETVKSTLKKRWTAIVERNISSPGVLVYSKTYCSFCAKLKALLRHLRIPFRVEVRRRVKVHKNRRQLREC